MQINGYAELLLGSTDFQRIGKQCICRKKSYCERSSMRFRPQHLV